VTAESIGAPDARDPLVALADAPAGIRAAFVAFGDALADLIERVSLAP
jgi:hypothetical protein